MSRIRVLVVDDSAFARKVVREILERDARFDVVGIARDGLDALEKIAELRPDVVTLDLVMPNLDGMGVLTALASLDVQPQPRVVVVSMSEVDGDLAITALQTGAIDFVHKPTALATDRLFELRDELVAKVAAAATASIPMLRAARAPGSTPPRMARPTSRMGVVVLGTSTGGPQALTAMLTRVPPDFPVPIAIALHMPVGYTEALARRLDQASAIEIVEAHEGAPLVPGRAVIARAGMHLTIAAGEPPRAKLGLVPIDKPHRPSVDVLFESAAAVFGHRALGVVLTGMGDDGTQGARAIRAAGGIVLTEAESSCVVYGMPRAVKEAGASSGEATLERMLAAILAHL